MDELARREVISGMIRSGLSRMPRGANRRLAEHLGVKPSTVTGYTHGHQAPDMGRWPAIEEFFGWEPHAISVAVGVEAQAQSDHELIAELRERYDALAKELKALKGQVKRNGDAIRKAL